MHCEKAYITLSLVFKTGKIIKLRDEWKYDSTNDKKCIGSSMPFRCVKIDSQIFSQSDEWFYSF